MSRHGYCWVFINRMSFGESYGPVVDECAGCHLGGMRRRRVVHRG